MPLHSNVLDELPKRLYDICAKLQNRRERAVHGTRSYSFDSLYDIWSLLEGNIGLKLK
jgi:hypothetical protein